jgi:NAD(P)-dependent dehydrogenase (short-subunit alcohol dehydrogenase family)
MAASPADMSGRDVLITGAGRGVGRGIALQMAAADTADVYPLARSADVFSWDPV